MKLRSMLFASLLFALLMAAAWSSAAQDDFQTCENPGGAYYNPNLFPRFTNVNNRLVLADLSTGEEVVTLAEGLPTFYDFSWSPDCHYIVGTSKGRYVCSPGLIVWDALSGSQNLALDGFCDRLADSYGHVFWKPDSSAVLLSEWYRSWIGEGSRGKRIIWYPTAGQQIQLQVTGIDPNLFQVYWDDARGWLWGSSDNGVTAFDTYTGTQTISFRNPPELPTQYRRSFTSSGFTFSPDYSKVILNGQHTDDNYMNPAMTVYDIASGSPTQVNVEDNGAGAVALSPDNRYLVMGYTAIRVWDLHNLPEAVEDRLPIYRFGVPGSRIDAVRFVDNTTIETTTEGGTTRWDILTGGQITE